MSEKRLPVVSVVMAVRNNARFVRECIQSIQAQTFTDFEFIIVNDGSTDGTPEILNEMAQADSRLVILHRPPRGIPVSAHEGCTMARGEFIARMDSDDTSVPERFQMQVEYLRQHPDIGLVGGWQRLISDSGVSLGEVRYSSKSDDVMDELERGDCVIAQNTSMFRRSVYRACGGYRRNFSVGSDYDLWCRIADAHLVANIPTVLSTYRVHEGQISQRRTTDQALVALVVCRITRVRRSTGVDPVHDGILIDETFARGLGITDEELKAARIEAEARWTTIHLSRGELSRVVCVLKALTRRASGNQRLLHQLGDRWRVAAFHAAKARSPWCFIVSFFYLIRLRPDLLEVWAKRRLSTVRVQNKLNNTC